MLKTNKGGGTFIYLKKNPCNNNFSPNNLEILIRQIRETMQCTTQKDTK